ncbi:hypothetical protein CEXT_230251 [Caerostris extrusa]|uniref:Uncharacterized protein n=1 Tax=Caerostris extrusa TaxID=172846 RepID=A0AAV4XJD2_CAEEX|nr:hypothetical protein CEXT_230251 [Caerostris extrusa]
MLRSAHPYGFEDFYFQLKLPAGVNAKDSFFIMHAHYTMLESGSLRYQSTQMLLSAHHTVWRTRISSSNCPPASTRKGAMFAPIQSGHSAIKYARTVRFKGLALVCLREENLSSADHLQTSPHISPRSKSAKVETFNGFPKSQILFNCSQKWRTISPPKLASWFPVNSSDPFFIMHAQHAMLGKWKSARLQYQKHTNASLCPPYGLEDFHISSSNCPSASTRKVRCLLRSTVDAP